MSNHETLTSNLLRGIWRLEWNFRQSFGCLQSPTFPFRHRDFVVPRSDKSNSEQNRWSNKPSIRVRQASKLGRVWTRKSSILIDFPRRKFQPFYFSSWERNKKFQIFLNWSQWSDLGNSVQDFVYVLYKPKAEFHSSNLCFVIRFNVLANENYDFFDENILHAFALFIFLIKIKIMCTFSVLLDKSWSYKEL